MRARWSVILLVLSAAACAGAAPRAGEVSAPTPSASGVPPIPALVGERERLGLTAAQVSALDSIARVWSATDGKLHRKMGVERGRRPIPVALGLHSGPTREALAENTLRAVSAVERVLTPAQRSAACELPRATETGWDHAAKMRHAWTWCAAASTASTRSGSAVPTRPWP